MKTAIIVSITFLTTLAAVQPALAQTVYCTQPNVPAGCVSRPGTNAGTPGAGATQGPGAAGVGAKPDAGASGTGANSGRAGAGAGARSDEVGGTGAGGGQGR